MSNSDDALRTSNEQAFRALLLEWIKACPNPPEWHWSFDLHVRTVNTLGERPRNETVVGNPLVHEQADSHSVEQLRTAIRNMADAVSMCNKLVDCTAHSVKAWPPEEASAAHQKLEVF
jgi:hypothetical protein